MYLSKEIKSEIFQSFGKATTDTGSAESQVALFTHRIVHLTNHLKSNKKDHAARLGLLKLVGKRRRFLNYLHNEDIQRYRSLIERLKIRK